MSCGLHLTAGESHTTVFAMSCNVGVPWSVLFSLTPTGESLTVRSVQPGKKVPRPARGSRSIISRRAAGELLSVFFVVDDGLARGLLSGRFCPLIQLREARNTEDGTSLAPQRLSKIALTNGQQEERRLTGSSCPVSGSGPRPVPPPTMTVANVARPPFWERDGREGGPPVFSLGLCPPGAAKSCAGGLGVFHLRPTAASLPPHTPHDRH